MGACCAGGGGDTEWKRGLEVTVPVAQGVAQNGRGDLLSGTRQRGKEESTEGDWGKKESTEGESRGMGQWLNAEEDL